MPLLEHWGPMCDVTMVLCMQSYIMEMTKDNDAIDHLTIPETLAAANGEHYDHAFWEV